MALCDNKVISAILSLIYEADLKKDYDERNRLVVSLLYRSMRMGWNCGIKIDLDETEWPVVYVDLPTGQVSWHLPQYAGTWDGHDNAEKYRRAKAFHDQHSYLPMEVE